jgi:hypothetical protein
MSNHYRRNCRRTGKAFQPDRTRLRKRGGFGASLLSSSKSPDQDHVMRTHCCGCLVPGCALCFLLKRLIKAPNMLAVNRRQRLQLTMSGSSRTSVGFVLASTISIDQTTSALQYNTNSVLIPSIQISTGPALRTLQWLIVSFSTLFSLGLASISRTPGEGQTLDK